jgi:signal transduction histidine kinase
MLRTFLDAACAQGQSIIPLMMLLAIPPAAHAEAPPREKPASASRAVLVLHTFGRLTPLRVAFDAAFENALRTFTPEPVEFFSEALDTSRFSAESHAGILVDYLHRRYAETKIDVVVTVMDPAFQFLMRHRAALFPDVPIVYMLWRQPQFDSAPPPTTGVWVGSTYRETIELALRVDPSVRHVIVVDSAQVNGGFIQREIIAQLEPFANRLSIRFLKDLPLDEVLTALSQPPAHSIVLYSRQLLRGPHEGLRHVDGLAAVSRASKVPVYGVADPQIGQGILGGYVINVAANARTMAEMALRLANGERAEYMPATIGVLTPMFDWRQVQRWQLPVERLPANAVVLFRDPAPDTDSPRMWMTAAAFAVPTVLVLGLLAQRRRRRWPERPPGSSDLEARDPDAQPPNLAGQLIAAQEQERRRVALHLHESLCQDLALLNIELEQLQRNPKLGEDLAPPVQRLSHRTCELVRSACHLSYQLHPSALEALGLATAIESLCADVSRQSGIAVHFDHRDVPDHVAADLALCFFRVAQEALCNVVKHSGAEAASVTLKGRGTDLVLEVHDSGVGFELARAVQGLGVMSMRERVRFLKGRFVIQSAPGRGTTLVIAVPVASPNAHGSRHPRLVAEREQ